ncbi:probable prefoldin subunit 4 [Arachis ipaensis]|nr:probable prefoldin subunit 4 [Arachis ipaensis]XP_025644873.1 probable prefoldin subunit 4 [Arachis hypogaea]
MQQGGGSDMEVTWEDEQNINKFRTLNNCFHELEDDIKIANLTIIFSGLISINIDIQYYPWIMYTLAKNTKDEVENRIENMKEVTSHKLTKLDEEKKSVVAQMAELKKILYGKFKDSINLEED